MASVSHARWTALPPRAGLPIVTTFLPDLCGRSCTTARRCLSGTAAAAHARPHPNRVPVVEIVTQC
jgi:hypothetical protein